MRVRKPFLYAILFATGLPITAIMVPVYALFVHFNCITDSGRHHPVHVGHVAADGDLDDEELHGRRAGVAGGGGLGRRRAVAADAVRIVLPLMLPGVAVVSIFVFVQAWGDFFVPFILLPTRTSSRRR